jgi:hypothetical protein
MEASASVFVYQQGDYSNLEEIGIVFRWWEKVSKGWIF